MQTDDASLHLRRDVAIIVAIVALQALVLHLMGRDWIAADGRILLWYGDVDGPGNSQHLLDWYTPSHILHGFIFYAALSWLKAPLTTRLAIAVGVEAAWEIAENTPMVIERYREGALAAGYEGDSIVNSIADTFAAIAGFWMAARLPVWLVISLAVVAEIGVGLVIRDNLTLNVIMLLFPIDAIGEWQTGN